jgi:hypothetical protein
MALPISVTYTFATATSAIPLSQLDANFTTVVNGINGIGNGTNALSNVSITGGTIDGTTIGATTSSTGRFSTVTATTGNITTINATTLNAATHRSDGNLTFQSNGTTTAMTIDTSQNVGIGTSSPSTYGKFVVSGGDGNTMFNVGSSGLLRIAGYSSSFSGALLESTNTAQSGYLPIALNGSYAVVATNGTERMRIDSSGNVGIGNTANNVNDQVGSVRPLLVSKSDTSTTIAGSTAAIVIGNSDTTTSNTSQLGFAALTGINSTYYTSAAINCIFGARTNGQYPTGQLVFSTSSALNSAPTEKMRLDNNGNLLVGATAALSSSKVLISCSMNAFNGLVMRDTGTTGGNYVQFVNDTPAQAGAITHNGSTTVLYTTSSDYRLKDTIEPMKNALARVSLLKPVTFKWRSDGSDGEGFIAHELQSVIPGAVCGEKDAVDSDGKPKHQGVDASFVVATLVAAIQELKAQNDELKARVAVLEAK